MATILLVDDEPKITSLTRRVLEKEGHRVLEAADGDSCLKTLETTLPDLILLDVMMPGEDGWEVCRKIKGDNRTKSIPVVMFTVRSSADSMDKSLTYAGANAQLNKPFRISELLEVIGRFIKK